MGKRYFDTVDWTGNIKVASGTITATASDVKTTIKKTSSISLPETVEINTDSKWLVTVETPINDTAANAVVTVFNVDKIDGTNARDVVLDTFTVTNVSATSSYGKEVIEGLFVGSESKIKLGITYAVTTSSELTAAYSIRKL
jgi:hypothetical protein